ncbi:MAG: helix-turn-helix transcriptional regulator [Clostridia bacterium]|nr:helix-turn-helix transcriptional regulator [Clostridia bacterium]
MILYQTDNSREGTNNDIRMYFDFAYAPHFHRDFELIYMVQGDLKITVQGKTFVAGEGQMALILSNLIHSYESVGETRVIVHVFSKDHIPGFAKLVADKDVLTPVFDCDGQVKDFYLGYCIQKKKRTTLAMKAVLYAVCNEFYEKSTLLPAKKDNTELIHRMLSYITEHYQEEISLEKMAQELGYEMHYLSRVFSANVKINLRRYINLYRVDAAKERLINSENGIAQIALESGFQSIRNFNRVFSASTGMTPVEYRKRSHEKKT